MRVQGAIIREQGQTFAVVAVKSHVVQKQSEAARAVQSKFHVKPASPYGGLERI